MPRSTYWGGGTVIAAAVWWFFLEFVKELLFGTLGTWVTSRMSDDGAQLLLPAEDARLQILCREGRVCERGREEVEGSSAHQAGSLVRR